jgi:S1-C subfamily serine protease
MMRGQRFLAAMVVFGAVGIVGPTCWAQSAGTSVEPYRLNFDQPDVLAQLQRLRESGKLMSADAVRRAIKSPSPAVIPLAAAATQPLAVEQIAAVARKAMVRVGWFVRHDDGVWRASAADGYALTANGDVATCFHCIDPNEGDVHDGYLFASSADGEIFPVDAVRGADKELDAALIHVAGGRFTPIALNDDVAPGDPVYLLSDPGELAGYFSEGIVNRFYWSGPKRDGFDTLAGARYLRIDVSTDWAPGSSGAAVLDRCGNVIGHVSTINTLGRPQTPGEGRPRRPTTRSTTLQHGERVPEARPERWPAATFMVMHEAVPARGVRLLVQQIKDDALARRTPTTQKAPD